VLGALQVLQAVGAEITERELLAEQSCRSLGHDDLAAVSGAHDPRTSMDVHPDVTVAASQGLTRMQTHPNAHA
jgi:hypothetical protein